MAGRVAGWILDQAAFEIAENHIRLAKLVVTRPNGTLGSLTFIRLTSPVRIIVRHLGPRFRHVARSATETRGAVNNISIRRELTENDPSAQRDTMLIELDVFSKISPAPSISMLPLRFFSRSRCRPVVPRGPELRESLPIGAPHRVSAAPSAGCHNPRCGGATAEAGLRRNRLARRIPDLTRFPAVLGDVSAEQLLAASSLHVDRDGGAVACRMDMRTGLYKRPIHQSPWSTLACQR